jgi:vacuolar-type H+-ATPase subunit E/Vma4
MSTENEKLERFAKAVNDEVNSQIEEILKQADVSRNEIIEKANDESLYDAYDKIKEEIKKITNKYVKIVSKAELDTKREILLYREKIANQVIYNVKNMLIDFTSSKDYVDYLIKLAKEEITDETDVKDIVVFVSEKDIVYINEIQKAISNDLRIEKKSSIKIGGLCVYFEKDSVIKDKTLDTALEEQKSQFNNSSRLRLN